MLSKIKVLEAIEHLPDHFSLDELVERLIIVEKIEQGIQQVKEGKTVSTSEAKRQLKGRLE